MVVSGICRRESLLPGVTQAGNPLGDEVTHGALEVFSDTGLVWKVGGEVPEVGAQRIEVW